MSFDPRILDGLPVEAIVLIRSFFEEEHHLSRDVSIKSTFDFVLEDEGVFRQRGRITDLFTNGWCESEDRSTRKQRMEDNFVLTESHHAFFEPPRVYTWTSG